MSEIVALVGKFISNPPFILCILVLGYLGGDRSKFARVITSVLFATILTSLLKSIFKLPLPPGNNEGWSFPSGHTITNIVLWFSIAIEYRNKIFSLLGVVACATTIFALIYYNYYYLIDIIGGIVISITWLALFQFIIKKWRGKKEYHVTILLAIISMIINYYNCSPSDWKYNLWVANAMLFGFGLGWVIISPNKININNNKIFKLFRILIGVTGLLIIYFIFEHLEVNIDHNIMAFFEFFLLSFWISFFTERILKHLNKILST